MGTSMVYSWLVLGGALWVLYFLACRLTGERMQKWFSKGVTNALQVKRLQTICFLPFAAMAASLAVALVVGATDALAEELPCKITGRWPVCEGTILGWYDGYRGSKGAAKIQVGDTVKGYDIRNGNIQEGEMVGVTVRMALNGNDACILEYKEGDSWVQEAVLPNSGREEKVVPKTILLNLLAVGLVFGCILDRLLRAPKTAGRGRRALRNGLAGLLLVLTLAGEERLRVALLRFQRSWLDGERLVNGQRLLIGLLCADVLFLILITPKSTGYRYWWVTAKEFFRELDAQNKG